MKNRRNHPEMVTLDLLNDLVARLDVLLDELDRSSERFLSELRGDPPQDSRTSNSYEELEVTSMDPQLRRLLEPRERAVRRETRDVRQILMDLCVLHCRLGELIDELEREQEFCTDRGKG